MRIVLVALTLSAALLTHLRSADACPGPHWNYGVFLRELNEAASAAPVVVEVEVLELLPFRHAKGKEFNFSDRAKARVVRSVKGAQEGAVVTLSGNCSSCGGCFQIDQVGTRHFLAGEFKRDNEGEFLAARHWHFDGRPAKW